MSHPFKRYCFVLAERLSKSINEIMSYSSAELSGWMAYDLTNDERWSSEYEKEKELEMSRSMTMEDRAKQMRQLLGGK